VLIDVFLKKKIQVELDFRLSGIKNSSAGFSFFILN